jgi:hypothetical protein
MRELAKTPMPMVLTRVAQILGGFADTKTQIDSLQRLAKNATMSRANGPVSPDRVIRKVLTAVRGAALLSERVADAHLAHICAVHITLNVHMHSCPLAATNGPVSPDWVLRKVLTAFRGAALLSERVADAHLALTFIVRITMFVHSKCDVHSTLRICSLISCTSVNTQVGY